MKKSREYIAKGIGLLWLLDGLLQFQPQMFGPNFVTNILSPLLNNQPAFLNLLITWGIRLWNTNTAITDTMAALLQIAIGVLLFFPLSSKTFKVGLWISIVWGTIVWLCGEGAGLLFTGGASFYTGAPGAVFVYVLIAILLLIPNKVSAEWYPKIVGWICIFGSLLQLQPSLWTTGGVQGNFMTSMMDPLHALSAWPNMLYNAVGFHPVLSNFQLALVLCIVGVLLVLKPNKIIGVIALLFLFLVWWFGQDFGQLSTLFVGTATDPNTAPLLALLMLPLFFGRTTKESVPAAI